MVEYPAIHQFGRMQTFTIVRRTSRFSVIVTDGHVQYMAHLTNSGRLHDLVYPGGRCLCIPKKPAKTVLRLVGVPASDGWAVMVDPVEQSRAFVNAANTGLVPWLAGWRITRQEVDCGESRLDLEISKDEVGCGEVGYIEIKSAAMLIGKDTGSFPDCPTLRGRKHLGTMRRLVSKHRCIVLFLVQHHKATHFSPNAQGDPVFASRIADAVRAGVEVRAVKMGLGIDGKVVLLDPNLTCWV